MRVDYFPLPPAQRGTTLIEILVSMFILALGVMALLAMQVKTSAGIKEAENMSIVAQATQNLAEGIMTNPTLINGNAGGASAAAGAVLTKQYDAYQLSGGCPASAPTTAVGTLDKAQMAQKQLNDFCSVVGTIPGLQAGGAIKMRVCLHDTLQEGVKLSFADLACKGGGTQTVIKVVWQMDSGNKTAAVNGDNLNTYSYQLPLGN